MEIYLILLMVKKDLEKGLLNFIGDADKRIKEDYLRILRYHKIFFKLFKTIT